MNTIGKILVFLNLVFALVVGGLLVYGVGVRAPWKEKYEALRAQAEILEKNLKSNVTVQTSIVGDYQALGLEIETLKQKLKATEDAKEAFEAAKLVEIADLKNKAIEKDLVTQEALKSLERVTQEVTLLNKTITDREVFINTVQTDSKVALTKAQSFEQLASATQRRNESLVERIAELTQKLAIKETGATPDLIMIRNPNATNPPVAVVEGKIERVDGTDGSLVQITLGSDHGVNKGNTLDVMRLSPKATWLGTIRIVEAYPQKSVARLVYTGNAAFRPQLRVDDVVTSKINR